MHLTQLPLPKIDPPKLPDRLAIDNASLEELAASLKDDGLLQPIIVRPTTGDRYEIVAGHRRYLAASMLNWQTIDAIVRHDLEAGAEHSRFAENIHRAELTPMEEALAVGRLAEHAALTGTEIAKRLNRSDSWVAQRRALIAIPDDLKALVHSRDLAVATALHLARVDDTEHRTYLCEYAMRSGANTAVIREWVASWTAARDAGTPDQAQRPELPPIGEPVTVLVPCYICSTPTPHTKMVIVRLCRDCNAGVAAAADDPPPPETLAQP